MSTHRRLADALADMDAGAEQEAYVQRIADAGLLDDYQAILVLIEKGIDLDRRGQSENAAKLYLQAFDKVEGTGAVAGASGHPLMGTRGSLLNLLGDLTNRVVKWSR